MKYAIVKIGGKQLKISEGETFKIERQESLSFDVLAYSDNGETVIGTPYLEKIKIKAVVLSEEKGNKIRIGRFKSKSRYQKNKGHRQPLSVVRIESIGDSKPEKADKAETKTETVEPKKKVVKAETGKKPVKAKEEKPVKKTAVKKTPVKSSKGKEKA